MKAGPNTATAKVHSGQLEGSQGVQSTSLPWGPTGAGCGATAPVILGASKPHHQTGSYSGQGRGGAVGHPPTCQASKTLTQTQKGGKQRVHPQPPHNTNTPTMFHPRGGRGLGVP